MRDLPTEYQSYIHLSRYSRWRYEDTRRETWPETIDRYISFFAEKYPSIPEGQWEKSASSILNLEVMPSMRCLMTAGKALARDNVAGFNCSYLTIDSLRAFDELMYVLMCGTGVGFSVERKNIEQIPPVAETFNTTDTEIVVADSKYGWARALRQLYSLLHAGEIPRINYSRIRPAGSPLKTFGGRASGAAPLRDLFEFSIRTFQGAAGRSLTSLECHDLVCKIAQIVVVGGVRRSALISLSDLDDERMRKAKFGEWWAQDSQRSLANNSAVYNEKPDMSTFMEEWRSLYESKSGERGIFSRSASVSQAARNERRNTDFEFGTNPCSEIILRPKQFCNLSEVVVRAEDSREDLRRKVRDAAFFGTLQSGLTDLKYLSKAWKHNTEEECLLGVSLTGILDNKMMANRTKDDLAEVLDDLKQTAIKENIRWASALKLNHSTAITCVKPSGTVSQLVDSASGIHTRHSKHYIRTIRADKKDPVAKFMVDAGFPVEDDIMNPEHNYVFSFPQKAPKGALCRDDLTAIEHLDLWLTYAEHWCEHKPSITISVKEHEWMEVGAYCYKVFDKLSGVSFLPHDGGTYQQAPYQECTKEEYEKAKKAMPKDVDWYKVGEYEKEDHTTASQELACVGNNCEVI